MTAAPRSSFNFCGKLGFLAVERIRGVLIWGEPNVSAAVANRFRAVLVSSTLSARRVESCPGTNLVERVGGAVSDVMKFMVRTRTEVDRAPI